VTNRTAAARYARALFDVALAERHDLEAVERELAGFVDLLGRHAPLEKVLLNPAVPTPRKRAAVDALVSRLAVAPLVGKLLVLLAARDRVVLLPDLLTAFRNRRLDHQRVMRAEVTTAEALAPARAHVIEQSLARATARTVTLATRVDPGIIGGLVARVGSTVYDGSIATQLRKMKQKLVEGAG
jgi:F-type H+-transporting ATPase subunit delta